VTSNAAAGSKVLDLHGALFQNEKQNLLKSTNARVRPLKQGNG